jgi:hypothetical protein
MARTAEHQKHIDTRVAHSRCPECRADNSRRFAFTVPFRYGHVSVYLAWIRPRLEAIRTKQQGGATVEARQWQRDFVRALHSRINSHVPTPGRKHAPEYAKYHLATYGNDWHYLND